MRRALAVLAAALALLTALCAAAEETTLQAVPIVGHAISLLEPGNPFIERYNRTTGENVEPLTTHGVPYFWGGREGGSLFAKAPDYVVKPVWQSSPAYYVKGKKYIYGFDCVGLVSWSWQQAYGTEMPRRWDLFDDVKNQIRNDRTGDGPVWDGWREAVVPGDLLLLEHEDGHHIAVYIGTLRMYGYTAEEVPELAEWLDAPLVIHSSVNAQISDRFAELIKHGLPKYHCATVTDGGVCVALVTPDREQAPNLVHQQNQDTRYFVLPDGTWLPILPCDDLTGYCWYRKGPEDPVPAGETAEETAEGITDETAEEAGGETAEK